VPFLQQHEDFEFDSAEALRPGTHPLASLFAGPFRRPLRPLG
jgi:hypothetical protein